MFSIANAIHRYCNGAWSVVAVAALVSLGQLNPGEIITFSASCTYLPSRRSQPRTVYDQAYVVCKSQFCNTRPYYLAQGWEKSDHLADGLMVRAFVNMYGDVKLVDGIQLSDGRIWVNGVAFERTDDYYLYQP